MTIDRQKELTLIPLYSILIPIYIDKKELTLAYLYIGNKELTLIPLYMILTYIYR